MLKAISFFTLVILISGSSSHAQTSVLDLGFRLQKTPTLYNENGISVAYSHKNLKPDKLYFGFSYVTSRLGTAFNSNAIKQDNFLLSSAYFFRKSHRIRPFVRASTGFFTASYGDNVFDDLPNSSMLLSTDAGLSYQAPLPIKVATSLGYNFISGDGIKGPGTLYPVYYQLTFSWNLFHKRNPAAIGPEPFH